MFRKVSVSGFRSLQDFSLELNPGLNVLIGPNGAGKTNVIKFFEFVSDLTIGSLPEAISRAGGAGVTFNRQDLESKKSHIRVELQGISDNQQYPRKKKSSHRFLQYRYAFEISLEDNAVFFKKQDIKFKLFAKKRRQLLDSDSWDCELEWSNEQSQMILVTLSQKAVSAGYSQNKETTDRFLEGQRDANGLSVVPLFVAANFFLDVPIWGLFRDCAAGKAFNINPVKVRESEDIARKPGIDFDGGGLASTLLNLQKKNLTLQFSPWFWQIPNHVFRSDAEERVQEYIRLVNQDILKVEARDDTIQNKIFVSASTRQGSSESQIPIGLLSDGTVKWLALMVAIQTNRSSFLIEEPENFLHPRLQQEIVRILRATCEADDSNETMAILTTHSETLLNQLYPNEVIVTVMAGGKTWCRRPNNMDVLSDIINETGFGLGHFYVNDVIEFESS